MGQCLWVATVDELIGMKRDTIAIYGADMQTSPRPQDFVDISILNELTEEQTGCPEKSMRSGSRLLKLRKLLGGFDGER